MRYFFPLLFLWVLTIQNIYAQLSVDGIPLSFEKEIITKEIYSAVIPTPDKEQIALEDEWNDDNRFAVLVPVNYNTIHSGSWSEYPDGSKVWRIKLTLKDSKAISLYFTDFNLPEGAMMYLYDEKQEQLKGAYSSLNNRKNGLFATEMILGECVIIELNIPPGIGINNFFTVSEVSYAYRFVSDAKSIASGFCEVNINCSPEAVDWQDEKLGIVRIKVKIQGALFWCSGSLINNLREDKTPYILTADHCAFKFNKYAAPDDLAQWLFDFNYESANCNSLVPSGEELTFVGAEKIAHSGTHGNSCSDFYLVKLLDSIPEDSPVYFNGWSAEDISADNGVCIHHPGGDVKKISTYSYPLITTPWQSNGLPSHWEVVWTETVNGWGVTEGGSSGSPIFDPNRRIIGTLTGGYASCNNTEEPDYYGKFSYHWDMNGVHDTLQLKPWLDPDNTGKLYMGGVVGDTSTPVPEKIISLSIEPNPVEENDLKIRFTNIESETALLSIYDLSGNELFERAIDVSENIYKLDVAPLSSGFYILKVKLEGEIYEKKFIKP
jgi:hypothetical protein